MMTDKIADLNRLQEQVKKLIAMHKRRAAISGRDYGEMTSKQVQKNSADLTWLGMDIDKAEREAHAAAVDCGIAAPYDASAYGPVDYFPSAFHHYRHSPTAPRCIAAQKVRVQS